MTKKAVAKGGITSVNQSVAATANNAAFVFTEQGDLARAENHARRAIALAPTYVEPRGLLAGVLDLTGRADDARAEFEAAFLIGRTAQLHLAYATFLARQGEFAQARRTAREGLDLDPDHPGLKELLLRLP